MNKTDLIDICLLLLELNYFLKKEGILFNKRQHRFSSRKQISKKIVTLI